MTNCWNRLADYVDSPDGRTVKGKVYNRFFDKLLYMWDRIKQEEQDNEFQINALKHEIQALQARLNVFEGLQCRGKRTARKTHESIPRIIELKKMKMSNLKIARELNMSEGTIRRILKKVSAVED
jgi:response regulator of citrate/malate metabolism